MRERTQREVFVVVCATADPELGQLSFAVPSQRLACRSSATDCIIHIMGSQSHVQ